MTMVIKVYRYAGRTRGRYPAFPPYGNDIESTYAEGCAVYPAWYHRHRAKQLNATAKSNARGRNRLPINGRIGCRSRKGLKAAA